MFAFNSSCALIKEIDRQESDNWIVSSEEIGNWKKQKFYLLKYSHYNKPREMSEMIPYKIDRLTNIFCITFDFSNQFLTTNFSEFRKELTILHLTNCRASKKKKCTAYSQNTRVVIGCKRCSCTSGVFHDLPTSKSQ